MSGYPELEFEEEVDPLTGEVRQVIRHVGIPAQEFLDEERRESERLAQSLTAEVRSKVYILYSVKKVNFKQVNFKRKLLCIIEDLLFIVQDKRRRGSFFLWRQLLSTCPFSRSWLHRVLDENVGHYLLFQTRWLR
jgi:hypothetical protein